MSKVISPKTIEKIKKLRQLKIFIGGLRKIFKIKEDDFRVSIRTYEDLNTEKCLDYWSQITGISKNKFISVNILKGKKKANFPMECAVYELERLVMC